MTNREAKAAARRLPFDFTGRTLQNFPGVRLGLERIAAKQLRRIAVRPIAEQLRATLREQLGILP